MTTSEPDYDDTDMTLEEFDRRMERALPADVTNLGGRTVGGLAFSPSVPSTGSSAETREETLQLAGWRDQTIRESLELVGT